MAKIGYGTDKKTRHMLKNGFKKITINNAKELEVLLMNNRSYVAELAHSLSAKSKAKLVKRA